jgi:hypothetical protein
MEIWPLEPKTRRLDFPKRRLMATNPTVDGPGPTLALAVDSDKDETRLGFGRAWVHSSLERL